MLIRKSAMADASEFAQLGAPVKEALKLCQQVQEVNDSCVLPFQQPMVSVIGKESSGKSEFLTRVLDGAIEFASGDGTTNKCPMEVRARQTAHRRIAKFKGIAQETSYSSDKDVIIHEENWKDTKTEILKYQERILQGQRGNFTERQGVIELMGSDVPDLLIRDIPGLIVNGDTSDINIVNNIALSAIQPSHAIILVIVTCNDNISNQKALQVARDMDPHGERTIGVLTMIDVPNGKEEQMLKVFLNEHPDAKIPKYGWFAVRGRTQAELNEGVDISKANENEAACFEVEGSFARKLKEKFPERCGIHMVRRAINNIVSNLVHSQVPQWNIVISNELQRVRQSIISNGFNRKDSEYQEHVLNTITKLEARIGYLIADSTGHRLWSELRIIYQNMQAEVDRARVRCRIGGEVYPKREEKGKKEQDEAQRMEPEQEKKDEAKDRANTAEPEREKETRAEREKERKRENEKARKRESEKAIRQNIWTLDDVSNLINTKGREIDQGANPYIYRNLVWSRLMAESLRNMSPASQRCLERVKECMKSVCWDQMAQMGVEANFAELLKRSLGNIIDAIAEEAEPKLDDLLRKHGNCVQTMNRFFTGQGDRLKELIKNHSKQLKTLRDKPDESMRIKQIEAIMGGSAGQSYKLEKIRDLFVDTDIDMAIRVMAEAIAFCEVTQGQFTDMVVLEIEDLLLFSFAKVLAEGGLRQELHTDEVVNSPDAALKLVLGENAHIRKQELEQKRKALEIVDSLIREYMVRQNVTQQAQRAQQALIRRESDEFQSTSCQGHGVVHSSVRLEAGPEAGVASLASQSEFGPGQL